MTLSVSGQDLWQWRIQAIATAVAFDIPVHEVDWLLQSVSSVDRLSLRLGSVQYQAAVPLNLPLAQLEALWQRRVQERVPVQYLVGSTPWRDFSVQVSPAVLIPRPETEQIIDLAITAVQASGHPELAQGHWADLGTGSGAIAIALARAFPQATIHAVDLSADALAIAQQNAKNLGLEQQIQFYQGSWLHPLAPFKGQLSGILANPPYIPRGLIPTLQPEVTYHEPHLALDGGEDGLDCLRHLLQEAPAYLQSQGLWLVEMMAGQGEAISALLHRQGSYHRIEIHYDLAGWDRFALAYRC